MLFFTLDIGSSNIFILWKRGGYRIAKCEVVTHELTASVWLLPIQAAKKNHISSEHRPDYLLPVCSTRDGYRTREREIITKQDTTKQKRPTNQHRDSRQLKRPSERDWGFPTRLLCAWVLAKYTVIFLLIIFTQPPIQSSFGCKMQISSFESG